VAKDSAQTNLPIPDPDYTLPEVLKLNGYSTAQFGKCHEVPVWQTSPVGPFDMWPTGSGFEHFYGFIGGETNQYYPALYEGTTPVEPPKTPQEGYNLTEDLADRAALKSSSGSPRPASNPAARSRSGSWPPQAPM
jgi:arylsulfatase A-like enzyme